MCISLSLFRSGWIWEEKKNMNNKASVLLHLLLLSYFQIVVFISNHYYPFFTSTIQWGLLLLLLLKIFIEEQTSGGDGGCSGKIQWKKIWSKVIQSKFKYKYKMDRRSVCVNLVMFFQFCFVLAFTKPNTNEREFQVKNTWKHSIRSFLASCFCFLSDKNKQTKINGWNDGLINQSIDRSNDWWKERKKQKLFTCIGNNNRRQ